jgi:Undecaprenyl-phosphate galactose phosphotransferase WbaP
MPALILGAGKTGHYIGSLLTRHPGLGLKPVGFLDDRPDRYDAAFASLPYLGPLRHASLAAQAYGVRHAIVAMPHIAADELASIIRRYARCFPHLLVIPDLLGTADLAVQPRNLGGVLGLEITQPLAQKLPQFMKRCVDVVLAAFSLIILSPLFLFLYIAVRLETSGPVFYPQDRIGREGSTFKIWKIRSMYCDGDQVLQRACRENPALAAEWQQYQKLREDPRVTQIGRRLRRLSLDELPQLWNVLRGDMSLVGPRPIVRAEVHRYEDRFASYALVRPGITGLWQVSGRNNTSYDERVAFDDYYVRNWSVWMDFYILARTLRTVLTCEGAY